MYAIEREKGIPLIHSFNTFCLGGVAVTQENVSRRFVLTIPLLQGSQFQIHVCRNKRQVFGNDNMTEVAQNNGIHGIHIIQTRQGLSVSDDKKAPWDRTLHAGSNSDKTGLCGFREKRHQRIKSHSLPRV
jgi:hypothetical protein